MSHGQAVYTITLPPGTAVGSYTVEASFSGSSNYEAAPVRQEHRHVVQANTATSVNVVPASQLFHATGAGFFELTADVTNADVVGDVVNEARLPSYNQRCQATWIDINRKCR